MGRHKPGKPAEKKFNTLNINSALGLPLKEVVCLQLVHLSNVPRIKNI